MDFIIWWYYVGNVANYKGFIGLEIQDVRGIYARVRVSKYYKLCIYYKIISFVIIIKILM